VNGRLPDKLSDIGLNLRKSLVSRRIFPALSRSMVDSSDHFLSKLGVIQLAQLSLPSFRDR